VAERAGDVFREQDQVQSVGGAALEPWDDVEVEVSSLLGFGVHEKASAPDPVGQLDQSGEHIL
jgi:hypothetical protein